MKIRCSKKVQKLLLENILQVLVMRPTSKEVYSAFFFDKPGSYCSLTSVSPLGITLLLL